HNLRAEFTQMEQKNNELRQAYQTAEKDYRQLERELDKLEQYLNAEPDTVSVQKNTKEPTR
ncbi:MAG: hypothetical protein K2N39_11140, partial [Lachnospiraceae bacterium]|nr:hypothetical protein [Lachnospiraceae bacterium]